MRVFVILACVFTGLCAHAQTQSFPLFQEPRVAFLDRDVLFEQSDFGKGLIALNSAVSDALRADLKRLEADLVAEETALVEQRKTDAPDVFKEKALLFDEKVKKIRADQDARVRELARRIEQQRTAFYTQVDPILRALMRDRGISLLLKQDTVLIASQDADITQEAIARINEMLKN